MNLATRLTQSLSDKQLAVMRLIADEASQRGWTLYAVGGLPRDLLLNRLTRDLDLVVEGDALPLARSLSRLHGGRVTTHPSFHTATWFLPPRLTRDTEKRDALDLISSRSETYKRPAALPTVKLGSITDDLLRRDFTINAMAIRLDDERFGDLLDPFGGRDDLAKETIRILHPRSFADDPTRIFRAARYAGRLGFRLAEEAEALIPSALRYVNKLSAERLRHELDLILAEEDFAPMLASLSEWGALATVEPAIPSFDPPRAKLAAKNPPADFALEADALALAYCLWFMDSPAGLVSALAKRLDFTAALTKTVLSATRLAHDLPTWNFSKPSEWTERLDRHAPTAIYAVYLVQRKQELVDYLKEWRRIQSTLTGDDLKKLGLPPGPAYKKILSSLRAARLDGEDEKRLLKSLMAK
ncbi:MAG: CCA-adding enzyme [Anaerolineales bacterium]|nr:CCA-adding enzyme [Anaerolineales bacterium]